MVGIHRRRHEVCILFRPSGEGRCTISKVIAITGGAGFIGARLVARHVEAGDIVRVLTRRSQTQLPFGQAVIAYPGDLTDDSVPLETFVDGADVLYHCAGEVRDLCRMEAVNVGGTRRLLHAAQGKIGRWVQLSSVGAYGARRVGAVTEDTPLQPIGVYEQTKTKADEVVETAAAAGVMTFSMLRPSIVFGPEMSNLSLFQMINMINKGLFFFIGQPGASANYIHVDNVVEGLYRCGAIAAAADNIYNVSDWRTIEDFVGIIARELGKPPPTRRLPEFAARMVARLGNWLPRIPLTEARIDALTNRTVYSSNKIVHELGYEHRITMEDGLSEMTQAWCQLHKA